MEAWLPTGVAYCTAVLHRPSINVEWGYEQGIGDAARADAFQGQFANNARAGVAGNLYWNAGYQLGPTSYDVGTGSADPLTFERIVANAP